MTQRKRPQRGKKGTSGARGSQRRGTQHDRAALDREIDDLTTRGPKSDVDRERNVRRNPPLETDISGPGGISMSGGVAGGARGDAGSSSTGAGTPEGYEEAGPGEQKGTSRFDYEHGTLDTPE